MKQHTVKGANIMRPVSQLKNMLPGIELRDEHMDGRGYPYGLQGPQIPLMARIIGVADTLDAMCTYRGSGYPAWTAHRDRRHSLVSTSLKYFGPHPLFGSRQTW